MALMSRTRSANVRYLRRCRLSGSECYWCDLTFTWNIKTMEGHKAIARMLEATLAATRPIRLIRLCF